MNILLFLELKQVMVLFPFSVGWHIFLRSLQNAIQHGQPHDLYSWCYCPSVVETFLLIISEHLYKVYQSRSEYFLNVLYLKWCSTDFTQNKNTYRWCANWSEQLTVLVVSLFCHPTWFCWHCSWMNTICWHPW